MNCFPRDYSNCSRTCVLLPYSLDPRVDRCSLLSFFWQLRSRILVEGSCPLSPGQRSMVFLRLSFHQVGRDDCRCQCNHIVSFRYAVVIVLSPGCTQREEERVIFSNALVRESDLQTPYAHWREHSHEHCEVIFNFTVIVGLILVSPLIQLILYNSCERWDQSHWMWEMHEVRFARIFEVFRFALLSGLDKWRKAPELPIQVCVRKVSVGDISSHGISMSSYSRPAL